MKNSYLNIFSFNKKNLNKTIKLLNKGEIVGLPTETVYGLAGNAYDKLAVKKIFNAKKRPKYNPLIVHYNSIKNISKDVKTNLFFMKLYKRLCPGPITFILKKKKNSKVNNQVTANLKTIAVRFPKHKIVRSILRSIDYPLAMPSANISSSISPVTAIDVYEEFKNKIKLIFDGGKSKIGIESTVIDLTNEPKILRPGFISSSKIEKILKIKFKKKIKEKKIKSPGMLKRHYSPGIPIKINQIKPDYKSAYIYLGKRFKNRKGFFSLSKNSNLNEAASNLYRTFRIIKKKRFQKNTNSFNSL